MSTIRLELIDELLKDYTKPEDITGDDGLLKQLTKAIVERALESELTHELGHKKHSSAGRNGDNSRNGKSFKTLKTDHTLLNLRGSIPEFIRITYGKVHDVKILDELSTEPGSLYIMDRGYTDFARLYVLTQCLAFFIIRVKIKSRFQTYRFESNRQFNRYTVGSKNFSYWY